MLWRAGCQLWRPVAQLPVPPRPPISNSLLDLQFHTLLFLVSFAPYEKIFSAGLEASGLVGR
jgi:hypothetical protein